MTRWLGFQSVLLFPYAIGMTNCFFPKGICWNTNWQHRFQRNVWPFAFNKNSQATFSFCAVHFSMIPPFSSVVSCTAGVESVSSSAVWSRIWSGRLTDILRLRAEEVGKLLMIVDHLSHLAAIAHLFILGPTWGLITITNFPQLSFEYLLSEYVILLQPWTSHQTVWRCSRADMHWSTCQYVFDNLFFWSTAEDQVFEWCLNKPKCYILKVQMFSALPLPWLDVCSPACHLQRWQGFTPSPAGLVDTSVPPWRASTSLVLGTRRLQSAMSTGSRPENDEHVGIEELMH